MTLKLINDLEKQYGTSSTLCQALCVISWVNSNWSYSLETLEFGSKSVIFLSCVTLKFDGWPWITIGHIFYATSSFVHHFVTIGEFKLELQSGNAQFGSKLAIFSRVILKFDGWHRKTIGHIFYATSSFVHHFIAISEFKLQLQSRNAQVRSKSAISVCPMWPWKLTDDIEKPYGTSSMLLQTLCIIS